MHVLTGDVSDRQVENIDVLLTDQIEQQIQGSLEALKNHLERLGGNVQIRRPLLERLSGHHGPRAALRVAVTLNLHRVVAHV